jgi:carboxymethylenebutenolidase
MTRLNVATVATFSVLAIAPLAAQQAPVADYAAAMRMMHAHDAAESNASSRIAPRVEVVSDTVTYATVEGKPVHGFIARPKSGGKNLPGLVVVHEWWGLNDQIRNMTERLAGEGYIALAVDLMGSVAPTPDSAAKLYQAAMQNATGSRANLAGAIEYLKAHGATKLGSVGWCFGGHWSLEAGLVGGKSMDAVVVYYGAPITDPARLASLQAPLLGLYGAKDTGIPADSVRAMQVALEKLGKPVTIEFFDAGHAFANPTGRNYVEAAADTAWIRTTAFFRKYLQ